MKYLLALDIDGTITDESSVISDDLACYLGDLVDDGAVVSFITGRYLLS